MKLRWMLIRDIPEIFRIENQVFSHSWSKEDFHSCLKQRNIVGMVADMPDGNIGSYMVYGLYPKHIEVVNFVVNPSYQRHGIGTIMMNELKDRLTPKRKSINLYVSEKNLVMHIFCKNNGLKAARVKKNFNEDAYFFVYKL